MADVVTGAADPFADPTETVHLSDERLETLVLGVELWRGAPLPGVRAEHFYLRGHRAVHAAVERLAARGEAVDVVSVRAELEQAGDLGLAFNGLAGYLDWWADVDPMEVGQTAVGLGYDFALSEFRSLVALRTLRDHALAVGAAAERGEVDEACARLARAQAVAGWLTRHTAAGVAA